MGKKRATGKVRDRFFRIYQVKLKYPKAEPTSTNPTQQVKNDSVQTYKGSNSNKKKHQTGTEMTPVNQEIIRCFVLLLGSFFQISSSESHCIFTMEK